MKAFLSLAIALVCPAVFVAQDLVPVAITTKMSLSEDQEKDWLESAKHLRKYFGPKNKTVRLVDAAEEAAVVVEVVGRGVQPQDAGDSQQDAFGRVIPTPSKDKVVAVRLSIGDYSTVIRGRDETWSAADEEAAREIEKWIKTNRSKLPARLAH